MLILRKCWASTDTLPIGAGTIGYSKPSVSVNTVFYHDCTEVTVNDRNPDSEADLDLSLAAADYISLTTACHGVVDTELVE